ncbi:M20/M25/M40 family metallo-hydrolase [Dactylosporangium matsuzakiense]|uniref:Hippurate hydrolase n=1 Tax=Dactylosporangium matsuzakiense TaxID=53360 RepID=A0A9W6KW84_9ACTN|nr:M20/M25/M40 family metallo-hydrolase [Dactylosporangium matsuzakiense]UWZ41070.1 M20/M25/M40 family metallo-hydrolase [Dactylosporangium matsuzakiense]GLL08325.1 hippurate hydrolase [Dactylosporangium matsuzakiense]
MTITRRAVLGAAAFVPFLGSVGSRNPEDLIDLRRDLHAHPEAAGQEQYTAGVVAQRLLAAGLQVTTGIGGHGVVGVLHGARRGRTVAYRADIDAVPPAAQFPAGPVTAHLCGHDIHTTVGVGVAEALARQRRALQGSFVFVFQPGEENLTGASAMLADHLFDRNPPAEIHALHCAPFPVGQFAVMPGFGLAGLDRAQITLPDAATAQSVAAAVSALGTVQFPQGTADMERLIADLQQPGSPLAEFVFMRASASGATVSLAYKCWPEQRYTAIRQEIERLAGPAAVAWAGDPFPAMVVGEREGTAVERYLRRAARSVTRLHGSIPFNGEDFALFLKRLPGTYTFLGVRRPGSTIDTAYPHFGAFDPDERAIAHGVHAMAGWLAERGRSR